MTWPHANSFRSELSQLNNSAAQDDFMVDKHDRFLFVAHQESDTETLGNILAKLIPPGTLVALCGTLGAGKTRLVQAIAVAYGIDREDVGSPTFSLSRIYKSETNVINHIDLFRINDPDEFFELGIDESLEAGQIVFVEWADKFIGCLPEERLQIEILADGPTTRQFEVCSRGQSSQRIIAALIAQSK
jgi:tRNA threonylcarbamoyladenosine biosynthesis protein TsaE